MNNNDPLSSDLGHLREQSRNTLKLQEESIWRQVTDGHGTSLTRVVHRLKIIKRNGVAHKNYAQTASAHHVLIRNQ